MRGFNLGQRDRQSGPCIAVNNRRTGSCANNRE
jgi:hypothetical protein